jgi:hypothetical protein
MTWMLHLTKVEDLPTEGNLSLTVGDEVAAEISDAVLRIVARPIFEREEQARRLFDLAMLSEPAPTPKVALDPEDRFDPKPKKGAAHTTDFNGTPSRIRRQFIRKLCYFNANEPKLALTAYDVAEAWDEEHEKRYSRAVWEDTLRGMAKVGEVKTCRHHTGASKRGNGTPFYYVLPTASETARGAHDFAVTLKQDVGIVKGTALA